MLEDNLKKYETYLINEIARCEHVMNDRFSSVKEEMKAQYPAYKGALAEFRRVVTAPVN